MRWAELHSCPDWGKSIVLRNYSTWAKCSNWQNQRQIKKNPWLPDSKSLLFTTKKTGTTGRICRISKLNSPFYKLKGIAFILLILASCQSWFRQKTQPSQPFSKIKGLKDFGIFSTKRNCIHPAHPANPDSDNRLRIRIFPIPLSKTKRPRNIKSVTDLAFFPFVGCTRDEIFFDQTQWVGKMQLKYVSSCFNVKSHAETVYNFFVRYLFRIQYVKILDVEWGSFWNFKPSTNA